jgi:hypothetical protein
MSYPLAFVTCPPLVVVSSVGSVTLKRNGKFAWSVFGTCVWSIVIDRWYVYPFDVQFDGVSVTVALADLVVSATLVAVTVAVACVTLVGAVYKPAGEMLPAPTGVIDHVTAVLLAFITVAVNCCV